MSSTEHSNVSWMTGFPPRPEERIRFGDGSFGRWPQIRWSLSHMDQLVPTKNVWRGATASTPFDQGLRSFDKVLVDTVEGSLSFADALAAAWTDGIIVLDHGAVAYEQYFEHGGPHQRHSMMSCNKSIVGTLAEWLITDGALDESAPVPAVLPELEGSAWSDATVRDVLDMRVGLAYNEDYSDRDSDVWRFLRCTGMMPPEPGAEAQSIAEVLPTFAKEGEHGGPVAYQEPNIFVLGWLVRRAANTSLSELVSERIWQHIGAEHDGYYMVDPSGAETTLATTLRDFARFGQLVLDRGVRDGRQVVPSTVIDRIAAGGDRSAFSAADFPTLDGWSYRSQWWIRHTADDTALVARGAYGQMLYVDPANQIVIARFGSARQASSALLDPIVLPTIDAIISAAKD